MLPAKTIRTAHAELLVAEDAAKVGLAEVLDRVPETQGGLTRSMTPTELDEEDPLLTEVEMHLAQALKVRGLHKVTTPTTGNCQAYSVAQVLANSSFPHQLDQLAKAAAALKKGCMARALIDFALKYPHAQRGQTLICLGRGYKKRATQAS